jgi:hypothetical protein
VLAMDLFFLFQGWIDFFQISHTKQLFITIFLRIFQSITIMLKISCLVNILIRLSIVTIQNNMQLLKTV